MTDEHLDADAAIALDMLLTAGTTGPPRGVPPVAPGLRMAASLARRPLVVARRGAALAVELARIGLGRSTVTATPADRRQPDPAWAADPLLRRLVQAHLAASGTASALVEDAALDPADREQLRSALDTLAGALAPGDGLFDPETWRALLSTRWASAVRGARRLAADLAAPPRVPPTAAPDVSAIGADLAATPGAVVLRTPVFELLQYLPQTEEVRDVPLLVVPPAANRYYLADLAPGRSVVEHLVRAGQQVFALSWRNPGTEHAGWDLDTYGRAVLDAMDACERITRTSRTSLLGLCSGGVVTAMLLAHLAAIGAQDRVASVTFAATVLDGESAGTPRDPAAARAAVEASARTGHLDGRALVEVLARLRPDDLVGPTGTRGREAPTGGAIRYWNADATRVPAALHRDLVDLALDGALVTPGATTMLGTPVDLSKIDRDAYVVAGIADPLSAWQACHRTTQLLGGTSRFVLSTGGHVAALLSAPGIPGASHRVVPDPAGTAPADPGRLLATAATVPGSWWPDHLAWLAARSGPVRDAPPELGGRGLHAVAPAPGDYVLVR